MPLSRLIAPFVLLAALAGAARAETVRTELSEAELVMETVAALPGHTVTAGLRLKHREGWHSYWLNPGDSGLPASLDWRLPAGWRAGPFDWPAPRRFPVGPLMNYGFAGEYLLPFALSVPADATPGSIVALEAAATWLTCAEICVPEEAVLRLMVPLAAEAPADPRHRALFAAARAALPVPSPWPASVTAAGGTLTLRLAAPDLTAGALSDAYFYPADGSVLEHAGAQSWRLEAGGLALALPRSAGSGGSAPAGPLDGVLMLAERLADGSTATHHFALSAAVTAAPAGPGLAAAAGLALAGGLLLNLMPCVFPILFLKALGLAGLAGAGRGQVRLHGLSYAAGVLASFAGLAGLMLALRAGGEAVGWGFQLQSPAVVMGLALMMAAAGFNLAGLFELPLPALSGSAGGGGTAPFLTGVLAVVIASPCTAPFMGVALGAALTMPAAQAMAVFLALGLGMALPFLALSLFPGLARRLPRPGAWMARLRQGLAFPLFATAAWLVWVLARQAGPDAVLPALAGMVLLGFAGWCWGLAQRGEAPAGLSRAGALLALAGALALLRLPDAAATAVPAAGNGPIAWRAFSEEAIAAARREGRPVLVNVTAAWCITCQVNEAAALSSPRLAAALEAAGALALKADWTRRDPAITRYLQGFGRAGVPFYALYPGDAGAPPSLLPALLSEGAVLAALGARSR
ncbi:MAG: thioredoxin family protein [Thalassobaculales bacterium]